MAVVSHPRLTSDEFDALLETIGPRHELIEGEVVVVVPDGIAAARASSRIARALEDWVAAGPGRGEVLVDCFVRLDDGNQVGPDVAWYAQAPSDVSGAVRSRVPELVVEVLSASTRANDLGGEFAAGQHIVFGAVPDGVTAVTVTSKAGEVTELPVTENAFYLDSPTLLARVAWTGPQANTITIGG